MSLKPRLWILATVVTLALAARPAAGRESGDPIRLTWVEGDVAGMSSILAPDGKSTLGFIEYRQHRRGDVLEIVRIARFSDGSSYDERVELPAGTYWGPVISIVIKKFERNATDGRLAFRTVVATPKPRVFDMELSREDKSSIRRSGGRIDVVRFALNPTVNWLIDPIIRRFTPDTDFLVQLGAPPSLARFDGPRNYAGQTIRIE